MLQGDIVFKSLEKVGDASHWGELGDHIFTLAVAAHAIVADQSGVQA